MSFIRPLPNKGDSKLGYIDINLVRHLTRKDRATTPEKPRFLGENYNVVLGQLAAESGVSSVAPYEPVLIKGTSWVEANNDNTHLSSKTVKCYGFTENYIPHTWGIAQEFITQTQPGRVLLSGVSWLNTTSITTLPEDTTHIHLSEGALFVGQAGRAIVLNKAMKPHTLVYLADSSPSMIGRALEDILPNGSLYDVRLYKATTNNPTESSVHTVKVFTLNGTIEEDSIVLVVPVENRLFAILLCESP